MHLRQLLVDNTIPAVHILCMLLVLWQWVRIPWPRGPTYDLLAITTLAALSLELYGIITRHFQGNNAFVYSLAGLLDMLLVTVMVWTVRTKWTALLVVAALVMIGVFIGNIQVAGSIDFLLTESIVTNALILSILLLTLLWSMAQTSEKALQKAPDFWLFMGALVYFGSLIPVVGVVHLVFSRDQHLAANLFNMIPGLSILRYLLAALACQIMVRQAMNEPR